MTQSQTPSAVSTPSVPSPAGAPLTPAQQAWHDAVDAVVAMAKAKLPPACGSRIDRARELVLAGHVELLPDGTAKVTSQTDGVTTYLVVNGVCPCEDFPQAPENLCKHRVSHRIARRAMAQATQRLEALTTPSVPQHGTPAPPGPGRPPAAANRRQAPTPEERIAEAVTQADRVCQAAVEATPLAYRGFLMFLPRNKKVGGTKSASLYAPIREPYLSVDGRVKMACDEHRDQGATLVVQTTFDVEPHSGQLLCRAMVTSALLGSVTAHARVFVGGSGVDESNPLENAETSAVGRALGFLGYGVYGTGIASADEVLHAQALRQGVTDDPVASETAAAGTPRTEGKPPTARQQALLKDLLRETGVPEEAIAGQLAQIATSREASTRIDQLRSQLRQQEA